MLETKRCMKEMNTFDGPVRRLDMAEEVITNVCQITIR